MKTRIQISPNELHSITPPSDTTPKFPKSIYPLFKEDKEFLSKVQLIKKDPLPVSALKKIIKKHLMFHERAKEAMAATQDQDILRKKRVIFAHTNQAQILFSWLQLLHNPNSLANLSEIIDNFGNIGPNNWEKIDHLLKEENEKQKKDQETVKALRQQLEEDEEILRQRQKKRIRQKKKLIKPKKKRIKQPKQKLTEQQKIKINQRLRKKWKKDRRKLTKKPTIPSTTSQIPCENNQESKAFPDGETNKHDINQHVKESADIVVQTAPLAKNSEESNEDKQKSTNVCEKKEDILEPNKRVIDIEEEIAAAQKRQREFLQEQLHLLEYEEQLLNQQQQDLTKMNDYLLIRIDISEKQQSMEPIAAPFLKNLANPYQNTPVSDNVDETKENKPKKNQQVNPLAEIANPPSADNPSKESKGEWRSLGKLINEYKEMQETVSQRQKEIYQLKEVQIIQETFYKNQLKQLETKIIPYEKAHQKNVENAHRTLLAIALGLAGIALLAASIATGMVTFGASLPVSILMVKVTLPLLIKALLVIDSTLGATLGAISLVRGGKLFAKSAEIASELMSVKVTPRRKSLC